MRTMVNRLAKDENGKALILALLLLVVGGLILTPLLGLMSTGLVSGQVYERKTDELYAADAGLEDTINWLLHGKPGDWGWEWDVEEGTGYRVTPLNINNKDVNITVEALADANTYKITSIATDSEGSTTVLSTLYAIHWIKGCYDVENNDTFYGDVYVDGNVTALNQGQIVGTLTLTGSLELDNNSDLEGDASVDGNIYLDNHSGISGTIICVTGNITLSNNTEINSDIHLLGDDCTITIDAPGAFITGNIWAEGDLTIDILAGNAAAVEIKGDVYAPQGTVHLYLKKSNSVLEGDIYAGVDITVTGSGTHDGRTYYFDEDAEPPSWICYGDNCDGAEPETDPPFEIADCPSVPVMPIKIYTYKVN